MRSGVGADSRTRVIRGLSEFTVRKCALHFYTERENLAPPFFHFQKVTGNALFSFSVALFCFEKKKHCAYLVIGLYRVIELATVVSVPPTADSDGPHWLPLATPPPH